MVAYKKLNVEGILISELMNSEKTECWSDPYFWFQKSLPHLGFLPEWEAVRLPEVHFDSFDSFLGYMKSPVWSVFVNSERSRIFDNISQITLDRMSQLRFEKFQLNLFLTPIPRLSNLLQFFRIRFEDNLHFHDVLSWLMHFQRNYLEK